uniref:Dicerlike 1 (DCL1) putative n=1 Tax=Albugo laibachii Nc14 TaxID=890382 RepID=F0WFS8_9STRA|nr:Dicerlike 1 (DCL1) putative [Albugo laibachii Nc14]|eukprot:CCA20062.1 Dicerlike 1 (DCL1) putative [Albugo laibachii Nc14]
MVYLLPHQHEFVSLCRDHQQNFLLCSPHKIGKTFTACSIVRAIFSEPKSPQNTLHHQNTLLDSALSSPGPLCGPRPQAISTKVIIIVPSREAVCDITIELGRLCAVNVVNCCQKAPKTEHSSQLKASSSEESESEVQIEAPKTSPSQNDIKKWEMDDSFASKRISSAPILILTSHIALSLMRRNLLTLPSNASDSTSSWFFILESMEQIQTSSPAFFKQFDAQFSSILEQKSPKIAKFFATASTSLSKLYALPSLTPILSIFQAINVLPILSPDVIQSLQSLPPFLIETFETSVEREEGEELEQLQCDPGDFLRGNNKKKLDLVRLYRMEVVLGNSAAIYDEKKCQEKVDRFISEAELIYEHLGVWCFYKFIELELLTGLQACFVNDTDNVNHSKRRRLEQINLEQSQSDEESKPEVQVALEPAPEASDDLDVTGFDINLSCTSMEYVKRIRAYFDVQETSDAKVDCIIKVVAWISNQSARIGLSAASPRLQKVASLIQTRMLNEDSKVRSWVFLSRRCYCRVVAEYLTSVLSSLGAPPCCCMLGSNSARICGKLHFSTYTRVLKMLSAYKTNVMVTTFISKEENHTPECDLLIVMDQVSEPGKLYECISRAHPSRGVIKYVIPNVSVEIRKYDQLTRRLFEYLEQQGIVHLPSQAPSRALTTTTPNVSASVSPYEMIFSDTGKVLSLENSERILSEFCDALPGQNTYDRRAEYKIRRHFASNGMTTTQKQYKKKRLKFNRKLDDQIDDCRAQAEGAQAQDSNETISYSVTLTLPRMLRINRPIVTGKEALEAQARSIAAFKACQQLLKRGHLDRNLQSILLGKQSSIHGKNPDRKMIAKLSSAKFVSLSRPSSKPEAISDALSDLKVHNSYDIPPVTAKELGLCPIRSKIDASDGSITMYLYGIQPLEIAILSSEILYTGDTNTQWRYHFATSDIMTQEIHPATLEKHPIAVKMSKTELHQALHFHLIVMRLACMSVEDAIREIRIEEDDVWKEFSAMNDKGYLVVATKREEAYAIDWEYVLRITGQPLLRPLWPLPSNLAHPVDEWIIVPTTRRNVTYVVQQVRDELVETFCEPFINDPAHYKENLKRGQSSPGQPILGRWHTREQIRTANPKQPMVHGIQTPTIVPLIRRVMQRNVADPIPTTWRYNERLLIPEYTSLLLLSKTRYFEVIGVVPLLYEFERKAQVSTLMRHIGLELDMNLLGNATSKPAYERCEVLGDTFLKLETSWYMYQMRRDIPDEGTLSMLRRDIIRNDRLCQFSLLKELHHYIVYPAELEQHPFSCWKPSCMGKTPQSINAPSKWIADVLEAICGAYIIGHGEKGARYFLNWVGIHVLDDSFEFSKRFYPDCYPKTLFPEAFKHVGKWKFSILHHETLVKKMRLLEQRLCYRFRNKLLLLEAITHPSVRRLEIVMDNEKRVSWQGNYERLEYLGDALIEYLTVSYAFLAHDTWLPGSLSNWKAATVSNDALGKTAIACFGVDEAICLGHVQFDREIMNKIKTIPRKYAVDYNVDTIQPGHSRNSTTKSNCTTNLLALPKILADVMEALVAAVFLDSGKDLGIIRDVFLGRLLDTIGEDARRFVCQESGLNIDEGGQQDLFDMEAFTLSDEE